MDNGRLLAAYTYHSDGRVESRTIADTIRTDFRYDADKNLTYMKTVDMTAQGRKIVWEEYSAYDHNGNMVEKRNLEGTTRYAYDANNQLVEVSYPGAGGLLSEKFGYVKAGNRLTRERCTADSIIMKSYHHDNCSRIKELNRRTYEPDGVTPKLKKSPAVSNNPDAVASYIGETSYYGYDRSGNLLSDGNATYTYDGFGRTAEVKMANGNSQINRYDAEGLRAEMEENGQLVQFLFNEEREVIAEETGNNVIRYVRGLGIISSDSESARTYYHYVSDNQGSVRLILTDTVNDRRIRNYYCYDAFGESIISHEDVHNRFRFNGEQYDPVTSQYYLRARFYNPIIGRFTQEDTYYGDGLNLYEYCRNNPVLYRDPSGHDAVNQESLYDEFLHVYRGTDKYAEIAAFNETGHLMSDATRNLYFETGNLDAAYAQSNLVHARWLDVWGNENDYVQAHGAFGTELSQAFGLDRTFMSVTTDPSVAHRFAGKNGRVFDAYIPKSQLIEQTLRGAGESEYLIKFGTGGFK